MERIVPNPENFKPSKPLLGWLAESKPTDWLTVGVSIVTLLVTLNVVKPAADDALDSSNAAKQIALDTGADATTTEGNDDRYIVQLATYQHQNCLIAQNELASYVDRFEVKPALFETSDKRFIVIGIEVTSSDQAAKLRDTAIELSEFSQFSSESLDQARVRHDPNWRAVVC
ncbi:hypothetical protein [Aliiroseovarius sp.]|uniref:hypothetical protein n=1 Tax=Aliiroseovarius sp. TaxID=1872442 RepID=UPI003BAA79F4